MFIFVFCIFATLLLILLLYCIDNKRIREGMPLLVMCFAVMIFSSVMVFTEPDVQPKYKPPTIAQEPDNSISEIKQDINSIKVSIKRINEMIADK
jgi:hypothetical protein